MPSNILELHLEGAQAPEDVRLAIADALGIQKEAVAVSDGEEHIADGAHTALVIRTDEGQYGTHVTLYRGPSDASEEMLARTVSRTLGVSCLISDDRLNPYSWTRVSGSALRAVFVDVEALDEKEQLRLDE